MSAARPGKESMAAMEAMRPLFAGQSHASPTLSAMHPRMAPPAPSAPAGAAAATAAG
jgi:hypothetical protein